MNIAQHPELVDRLAASYALGTLRGGARRRFETLAREHATVRAAALVWQGRWSGLTELQGLPPAPLSAAAAASAATPLPAPSANVWVRIQNLVQADLDAAAQAAARGAGGASTASTAGKAAVAWWRNLRLWQGAAAAGALATAAAVVVGLQAHTSLRSALGTQVAALQQQLQATPQIRYVAVLADEKADASVLVTFDARNQQLVLERLGNFQEGRDKSLQLWALPPGGAPRSLGVLGQDRKFTLTAAESQVRQVPTLAISLEPLGGVPGETGPTGPVLFKGPLVTRTL